MRKELDACPLTEFTQAPILGHETTCLCLEVPPVASVPWKVFFFFNFFINVQVYASSSELISHLFQKEPPGGA